jgi:hypothetical protein
MTLSDSRAPLRNDWRLWLGVVCFVAAWAIHLITLAVAAFGASATTVGAVAAINFALNKVLLVVSAAILGKSGFNRLKAIVFGALKRYAPPHKVGPLRYSVGIVLFVVPVLLGWVSPYIVDIAPSLGRHTLRAAIIGDAVFLSSLFVLGGGFWDKLRALFVHQAEVVFPDRSAPR